MDFQIKHKNNLIDACIYPFMDYCTLYISKDSFEFYKLLLITLRPRLSSHSRKSSYQFNCQYHKI